MKQVTIIYRNCNNPNAINFIKNNLEEVFWRVYRVQQLLLMRRQTRRKVKGGCLFSPR